jgi:Uma2 family endonuclease
MLYGKTWADYDAQLAIRGLEGRRPKLAFLEGALELMSPGPDHERIKWHLGRYLEVYCTDVGISMSGIGEWTIKDESKQAGVEPDECYFVGRDYAKRRPDLAIEVVWTHGGIEKLEIYRRLGVPEVWFWDDEGIVAYVLTDGGFEPRTRSGFMPDLDLSELARLANGPRIDNFELRDAVKRRLLPKVS